MAQKLQAPDNSLPEKNHDKSRNNVTEFPCSVFSSHRSGIPLRYVPAHVIKHPTYFQRAAPIAENKTFIVSTIPYYKFLLFFFVTFAWM